LLRGPKHDLPDDSARVDEVEARKDAAFNAIVDLENEQKIGKLSAADAVVLRTQYEAQALAALRDLDALRDAEVDQPLESEIAALRERLRCPSCGAARTPGDACPRCGARL
jgi:hypothetical protein